MSGLPEPVAQGDLARTPFAHVLLHVQRNGLTGSLVLWDPEAGDGPKQDRIRFVDGKPVSALLRERFSQLDRSLLPLFPRAQGPYAFYADVDLVGDHPQARAGEVEVLPLLAASLRGSSRDDAVTHVVDKLGDQKLRVVAGVNLGEYGLLPKEKACVELLLAEPASVSRLQSMCQLSESQVARLVYLLAITKAVEVWDGEVRAPAAPRRPAARPAEGSPTKAEPKKSRTAPDTPDDLPPMPSDLSADHQALWQEIARRAATIETENYFVMLGVPRDVSAAAVQKAYFALVKKWHPDRVPGPLQPLRPTVERIFGYLTRAQETLSDEDKRGPYLQNVQAGGGTPEADRQLATIVGAAMEFRKVEVLLRRSEWDEALTILDELVKIADEEADYHATRAWVLFQKHGTADHATRMEIVRGLERAIDLVPKHDKAHYWMGLILKREGKAARALEHFRVAAESNPRNLEAVREVRIASMRKTDVPSGKSGAGEKKGGGLLDKLFGGKK
ncbi:MAG: DnaJ domain-containing protein [Myxococcales bacterium]|nr:DnaJ domain-containing protein [Myxococcales bacterium]